jgi:hypothetical protein
MSEQMTYSYYESEVNKKVQLTENEKTEIVQFLYDGGWSIKDCVNHIDSVRRFNKTLKD